MTIPVKKIGEISLAIFESIFATKICNFQDNKAIIAYFNVSLTRSIFKAP